ncbi:Glycoprotein gp2 [Pseudonocardia sp. Ae168_Ps1]|uniref:glucuronyl esterase domain-containing protein n=1 Tax=unclassified Pseudonocardia TaxID=2619320 RepID=UPI0009657702|nr:MULTISPECIES: acetylxylan esterase [unclassified Pseudonocardia]OLL74365.1 Glycoprotein gp2 [Pseudonocardia sp. Ae150A_Ps1]OLL80346.1 Glycoprotein gp2 [Pseudonocardia sp. Ae168_Ps1]OLL85528.1 Glycoprotein gp2 [Pseudonocardia sp. Ae263_Ps1]
MVGLVSGYRLADRLMRGSSAAIAAVSLLALPAAREDVPTSPALVPAGSAETAVARPVEPVARAEEDIPDPLVLDSGEQVESVQVWEKQRRPELLAAFREQVYGQTLPAPTDMSFDEESGSGGPRKVTINVTGPEGSASFTLRVFVPSSSGKPEGTFLLIDHRGSVGDDPDSSGYAPVSKILDAGYAVAALNAEEVAPDDSSSYRDGVINAFYPSGRDLPDDAGRTISAWAWGASRAMDYLETDSAIDPSKVAVIGHSRGAKAALWAGAQDTRFPVVVSNNSGSTGAKLARRDDAGESIAAINSQFPHWFPETYKAYNDQPTSLPVDQHELLALIAPGRVVVGSASEDGNADPEGEYLSFMAAAPVYDLYGLGDTGLANGTWPPKAGQTFRSSGMSYHLRSGGHGLEDEDWAIYLEGKMFER